MGQLVQLYMYIYIKNFIIDHFKLFLLKKLKTS